MCGGSQSNSEDLITLLTGLTFADSSLIHRDSFFFSLHDKPQLSHGVLLLFAHYQVQMKVKQNIFQIRVRLLMLLEIHALPFF